MSYYSGIVVDGVLIHPPEAYAGSVYWLRSLEAALPAKAKEMWEYSQKQGWARSAHEAKWIPILIDWYTKKAKAGA